MSELTIGGAIRVSDLTLPSGVETEVDPEEPVVIGQAPQAEELPEVAEGEEGEAAAEGEAGEAAAEGETPSEGGGEE